MLTISQELNLIELEKFEDFTALLFRCLESPELRIADKIKKLFIYTGKGTKSLDKIIFSNESLLLGEKNPKADIKFNYQGKDLTALLFLRLKEYLGVLKGYKEPPKLERIKLFKILLTFAPLYNMKKFSTEQFNFIHELSQMAIKWKESIPSMLALIIIFDLTKQNEMEIESEGNTGSLFASMVKYLISVAENLDGNLQVIKPLNYH